MITHLIRGTLSFLHNLVTDCSIVTSAPSRFQYEPRPRQSLQVNGVAINYQASLRQNLDTTVVMVHGFGAALETWDDIYPSLAAEFSVVRLDLKGSGFSSKPAQDSYSLVDQSKILLGFIKSMGLRKVVVIGHSLGGAISLISYLQYLDTKSSLEIVGLILIDSSSYPQQFPFFVGALRNPVTRFLSELLPVEIRIRLVLNYSMRVKSQITTKKIQGYSFFMKLPGAEFALAQTAKHIVPLDVDAITARFSEVSVPTLIIWGKDDRVIPLENGYRLHAAIQTSQLIILPETGHIPHEERPEEVMLAIKEFLRKVK